MSDPETKDFDTVLVASTSCGVMLANGIQFSDLHGLCEFVMGHPIWTHEFADRALWVRISETIREQLPEMPNNTGGEMSMEAVAQFRADALELFGPKVTLRLGSAERSENPIASLQRLAPGKPVIAVGFQGNDEKAG